MFLTISGSLGEARERLERFLAALPGALSLSEAHTILTSWACQEVEPCYAAARLEELARYVRQRHLLATRLGGVVLQSLSSSAISEALLVEVVKHHRAWAPSLAENPALQEKQGRFLMGRLERELWSRARLQEMEGTRLILRAAATLALRYPVLERPRLLREVVNFAQTGTRKGAFRTAGLPIQRVLASAAFRFRGLGEKEQRSLFEIAREGRDPWMRGLLVDDLLSGPETLPELLVAVARGADTERVYAALLERPEARWVPEIRGLIRERGSASLLRQMSRTAGRAEYRTLFRQMAERFPREALALLDGRKALRYLRPEDLAPLATSPEAEVRLRVIRESARLARERAVA